MSNFMSICRPIIVLSVLCIGFGCSRSSADITIDNRTDAAVQLVVLPGPDAGSVGGGCAETYFIARLSPNERWGSADARPHPTKVRAGSTVIAVALEGEPLRLWQIDPRFPAALVATRDATGQIDLVPIDSKTCRLESYGDDTEHPFFREMEAMRPRSVVPGNKSK